MHMRKKILNTPPQTENYATTQIDTTSSFRAQEETHQQKQTLELSIHRHRETRPLYWITQNTRHNLCSDLKNKTQNKA